MAKAGLVCPPRRKTAQDRSPEPQLGKRARAGLAEVTVMQGGPPGQNVPWNKEPLVRAPPEEHQLQVGAPGPPSPAHLRGPERSKAADVLMFRTEFPGVQLGHPKGKFLISQLGSCLLCELDSLMVDTTT